MPPISDISLQLARRLGSTQVSELVSTFLEFAANMLLGAVIILIGSWISNLAAIAIRRIDVDNAAFFAGLARHAILGLVLATGLRAMGIAGDIVNLAFALTLGAVALTFGLGGREATGKPMEHWTRRLRGGESRTD